jgi:hypothetical protein
MAKWPNHLIPGIHFQVRPNGNPVLYHKKDVYVREGEREKEGERERKRGRESTY